MTLCVDAGVGAAVGDGVGLGVGAGVGHGVGLGVGFDVGSGVGFGVGLQLASAHVVHAHCCSGAHLYLLTHRLSGHETLPPAPASTHVSVSQHHTFR